MPTIGAYAFITPDWKERYYPLDLWLEHHLPLFDQIALVKYPMPGEDFILPIESEKLRVGLLEQGSREDFVNWCCSPKRLAMNMLDTEWKFLLEVDEFIHGRPDPAPDAHAYHCNIRNFLGNVNTQVIRAGQNGFVCEGNLLWKKFHRGNQSIYGDGCAEQGAAQGVIDVFHTTLLRPLVHIGWEGIGMNYDNWRHFWHSAELQHISDESLPATLVKYKEKFHFGDPK